MLLMTLHCIFIKIKLFLRVLLLFTASFFMHVLLNQYRKLLNYAIHEIDNSYSSSDDSVLVFKFYIAHSLFSRSEIIFRSSNAITLPRDCGNHLQY